jgi:hypothetical protein
MAMKSTVFELTFPEKVPSQTREEGVKFLIPTLHAYAVEYSEFTFRDAMLKHKQPLEGRDYVLAEDGLIWQNAESTIFDFVHSYRLVIHYHGIRDYSLLFPHVNDINLRNRLGDFYQEAESSFDRSAWLSFVLMCGALYEGLLYSHFCRNDNFSKLIERALKRGIIDLQGAKIMTNTRELRNLIHANNAATPFVKRSQAMDTRTVMDKLIKNAPHWPKETKDTTEGSE